MSRRLDPLTGDAVEELPVSCASCLVWELGAATPSPRLTSPATVGGGAGEALPSQPQVRKQAWVSAQVQDGHPPGRIVRIDDEVAGYALFAPSSAFAARRPPCPQASPDALLLATIWIGPHWRERGIGRLLVQAAVKDAIRAGAKAVEAYGDRRWLERGCVLPATWLLHEGFEVHREHPRTPLLRLDVRRTVRWAESLEHALEEVLGALPRRVPQPVRNGGRVPGGLPEPNRADPHRADPHRADPHQDGC
ncbi:MAG: GNAT family N-acetyltransferase [Nitriliruptor sp.]